MSRSSFRLVAAQTADAATFLAFYVFIGAGVHAERNPLILGLMALGGIQMVAFTKVGVSLYLAWRREHPAVKPRWWSKPITSRRFIWVETVIVSAATASGIVGAGMNTAAIVDSLWRR